MWRWAFFLCGFVPILYISRAAVHLLVIVVEYAFFTSKVMYYLYGIRVRPPPSVLHFSETSATELLTMPDRTQGQVLPVQDPGPHPRRHGPESLRRACCWG